ncbi:phytoene desaturase family protein [Paenibacillus glycanilyticus]|uniref:phytoene desaturase family protein n=1 Tax=Paenibacillus glycanilyticus TaxID=126569 RepID=UPI003EBD7D4F
MKRAVIIGGGIGGLSAAVRLAAAGWSVTILEQQKTLGGKLQKIQLDEFSFDRGPSTITMRHAFQSVFAAAGRQMEDYVEFVPIKEGTRNVFPDGSIVDVNADLAFMEEQIAAFSYKDSRALRPFMRESERLYRLADNYFMNRLLLSWRDKTNPLLLKALLQVRPLLTLDRLLRRYFTHPHTLALFGRYATYVGSDPRRAPSIFAMLPYLEAVLGVYSVKGGTYSIVDGLRRLAEELGVHIHTMTRAKRIIVSGDRASGVETENAIHHADIVVANGDVLSITQELLDNRYRPSAFRQEQAVDKYEPSLSGFVLLAGTKRQYDLLRHHTVFYPDEYGSEFEDIFVRKRPPREPAIYVCWSGRTEAGMAPEGGSNLFILVNAPYCTEELQWNEVGEAYAGRTAEQLERRGLHGLSKDMIASSRYTPEQLRKDTSAYRGAIYGISSNSPSQTFARPSNRSHLKGLWFVGGTTHPGGGTPLVALSGRLVAEAILNS